MRLIELNWVEFERRLFYDVDDEEGSESLTSTTTSLSVVTGEDELLVLLFVVMDFKRFLCITNSGILVGELLSMTNDELSKDWNWWLSLDVVDKVGGAEDDDGNDGDKGEEDSFE